MIEPGLWKRAAPALSAVWSMTAAIVLGAVVGTWLDRKLGLSPIFLVALSFGGLIAGAVQIARGLNRQSDDPPGPPPP